MIPVNAVILEGVDCSGKSTLYSTLHKTTKFKYNIIDRSRLSRLCYARLYGRDTVSQEREALLREVCTGNNFLVVLMPPLEVVIQRLSSRGDEFQDEASVRRLYSIFDEEVAALVSTPNVHVVRSVHSPTELASSIASTIDRYFSLSPAQLGDIISNWCDLSGRREVQYRAWFEIPLEHADKEVMRDPREGEYYSDIEDDVHYVIDREIEGNNPYNVPQDVNSRRFYFHSDTCISSIHFLPRDGHLKVLCTLRSTDSIHNGNLDLRFLAHLSASVARQYDWGIQRITLDVTFNSLHIRK